ncbi:MAG: quinoprotein dehydrogenase-associated putative ABC transporter substrate-binding protein [Hyphomicrobium sp.]|nr:quinoprotein dehydrogenase-associated putative ABC transporter substrate-binding protein [Hyphomicrobium sp.]
MRFSIQLSMASRCFQFALLSCAICAQASPAVAEAVNDQLRAAFSRLEAQLPLTAGDHTALKKAAAARNVSTLRVCGDPGNLPLSDINRAGYQNKIIELIAREMGAEVNYFWRPYLMRGITRQTFDTNDCDILLDMPASGFAGGIITTNPIYKTTYVLAYRSDKGLDIKSLDDPKLRDVKIGVFQTSGLRTALTRRGIISNVSLHVVSHNSDLNPDNQPWQQVKHVLDGKLDVAGVWGPFAGWLKERGDPLIVQPVNLWEDEIPQEFELAIGLRKIDWVLKYKFDLALDARRADVEKILREFGVPLVECSKCVVQGNLPQHGIYTKPIYTAPDEHTPATTKSPDQMVTRQRLEAWLQDGADLNLELANAVLASDAERVRFLVDKGADINGRDNQGYAVLQNAARNRDDKIVTELLALKADVNATDSDGMTALHHAVMRNHPETIMALAAGGAKLDVPNQAGYTPLAIAIIEDQFKSAMALIEAGAPLETAVGPAKLTPLMLVSGKEGNRLTLGAGVSRVEKFNPKDPGPIDIARALLAKGANVNAVSGSGLSALLLAAAHNNAPIVGLLADAGANRNFKNPEGKTASDLAVQNGNTAVVSLLKLLDQAGSSQ